MMIFRINRLFSLTGFLPSVPSSSSIPPQNSLINRYASGKSNDRDERVFERTKKVIEEKTPKGRLDEEESKEERHRDAEKEPLPKWPNGENPNTGEKNGPAGLEPTRFGDWERKGRVTDF